MITKEELKELRKTFTLPVKQNRMNLLWKKAFEEYNEDKKEMLFKPLELNCLSCYHKVYSYLHGKVMLK